MAERNEGHAEQIEDILEKIKEEYRVGSITETKNESGATEFVFREEPKGLVFEEVKEEASPLLAHEKNAPRVEETVLVDREKKAEEPPRSAEEEFLVPESFDPNEKYNTPIAEEERPRIWTTYLPRFTEVSETYRMANDPRPRVNTARGTEKPSASDPTAETDAAAVTEAKEIHVDAPEKEEDESLLRVMKPAAETAERAAKPIAAPSAEEEEARIRELLGDAQRTPPPVAEVGAEIGEEKGEATAYDIPDAVSTPAVLPYGVSEVFGEKIAPHPSEEPISILTEDGKHAKSAEYTSFSQRFAFKDRFVDAIVSVRIRFIVCAVLTGLLLLLENLSFAGVDLVQLLRLSSLPGALAWIDLEVVLCLFFLTLPETVATVRSLLNGRAKCEFLLPIALLFDIVYTLAVVTADPERYLLFGFLYGIFALSAIASTYFSKQAEFMSFKLVSINGKKQVVGKKLTRTLERENLALDGTVDEARSKTARFFSTTFVSDFFRRNSKSAENSSAVLLLLSVSLGVSLVIGAVMYFLADGMVSALAAFLLTLLLSFPSFTLLSHKLSYFFSERESLREDSTVIGETSYYDYESVDVVTFDDTEIFGRDDVALKRAMLYGDKQNFTKALKQMSSLFSLIGGPLDYIFANALEKRYPPAEHAYVEADGIRGDVEGVTVYAGTEEYMRRYGIVLPAEDTAAQDTVYDTTRVMYAAEAGRVYAKFYLRYSFSEKYTMLLPLLKQAGIVTLVYTRDPNVNSDLVRKLTTGEDIIRVMHKTVPLSEDKKIYPRISAGIVTLGDKTNAINMLLLSKKYVRFQRALQNTATAAAVAGGIAAILLSLFGALVPTLFLGVWQGAWIAVLAVLAGKTFPTGIKKKRRGQRQSDGRT